MHHFRKPDRLIVQTTVLTGLYRIRFSPAEKRVQHTIPMCRTSAAKHLAFLWGLLI